MGEIQWVDRQGNETAVGWTVKQPHGWTDDWYRDYFKVLRKFKQTHVGNCKSMTTERRREREMEKRMPDILEHKQQQWGEVRKHTPALM